MRQYQQPFFFLILLYTDMGNFQLYLLSRSEYHHLFLSQSSGVFSHSETLHILFLGIKLSQNGTDFYDSLYGDFLLWCDFLSYKVSSVGCYLSYRTQDILCSSFITVIFTSVTTPYTFFTFTLDLPLLFTDMMVKLLHVRRNKLVALSFHCVRFINQPYTAITSDIILVY
jgi:hypothetical protein